MKEIMRKMILSAGMLFSMALLQSCGEAAQMDPAMVQAKVDSLAASKIEEATAKATADCETRMTTEVKAMADSLVQAKKAATAAQ
jgi:hypothetical protein